MRPPSKQTLMTVLIMVLLMILMALCSEIRIMESLHSPYIVGYYGSVLQDGHMWIVMELCQFGSVNGAPRSCRSTLPPRRSVDLDQI